VAVYADLTDKVVIVTGGASGIGADMVRAFAGQGAKVAFLDVLDEDAAKLVEALKPTSKHTPTFFRCDLTDMNALQKAVQKIGEEVGAASVLINNAANDTRHTIAEVTSELWDDLQTINLKSQFFMAQAVQPMLKANGGGAIINLSSITWRFGADVMAVYSASKAGVIGLTKALARAFGPDKIRVNAIEPGAVMTERQRRLWYKTQESVDAMLSRQILHETLLGSDVASMALFLASDDARLITKQSFIVDAGLS
jgi:NAD(P)-dependent dehydrogenase (short-subunit alcohol dehydrogenase family)